MNNLEINKIYCENNLDTMAKMPDNFVDYVLTSPPYNVGNNKMVETKYNNYTDDLDDYFNNQKNLINELLRVTKKHVFYNIQMLGNNKVDFLNLLGHFKDKIKDIIIWQKNGIPVPSRGMIHARFRSSASRTVPGFCTICGIMHDPRIPEPFRKAGSVDGPCMAPLSNST